MDKKADFLDRIINYIQENKKKCIIIGSIAGVVLLSVIIASIVVLVVSNRQPPEKVSDVVEMMQDLVNEPVSPEDEPYTDEADKQKKLPAYMIRVNKTRNCITVYQAGDNGAYGEPVKAMVCSAGYDAPVGTYQTSDRYTWKIVNGNVWSQYATRITGNVLFHSAAYSEKDKSKLINRYFNQLGTNASTGSIRVMAADAKWLMENCTPGTQVEIYEDQDPGPLGKPVTIVLQGETGWDPSDPDENNPWKDHTADIQGVADKTVERGIEFDYLQDITATDTVGNDARDLVKVETDLDVKKPGGYHVTFTLTDGVGHSCQREAEYQVVDTRPPYFSGIRKQIKAKKGQVLAVSELLEGVFVVDNNEILPNDRIKVTVPALVEGDNTVTYTVADDYGNENRATTIVHVDSEPPVIHLVTDAARVLDANQQVDENYALSRVYVTDSGEPLDNDHLKVSIYQNDWGYTFMYTATDDSGQTANLTDTVVYPSYTVSASSAMDLPDLNEDTLMQGVSVIDDWGNSVSGASVGINIQPVTASSYQITYSYTYSCVLGTRTATAERLVTIVGVAPSTETPLPSDNPGTPGPSQSPDASQQPGDTPSQQPGDTPSQQPANTAPPVTDLPATGAPEGNQMTN